MTSDSLDCTLLFREDVILNFHGLFYFKRSHFSPVWLHFPFYSIWNFDDSDLQKMFGSVEPWKKHFLTYGITRPFTLSNVSLMACYILQ